MGTKFKRIEDIEEKIHSAKLPYNAWKVFFLIDGEVGAPQIAEFLDEDINVVAESLKRLEADRLVVSSESEETIPSEEPEEVFELTDSVPEETEPAEVGELITEEPLVEEVEEFITEETTELEEPTIDESPAIEFDESEHEDIIGLEMEEEVVEGFTSDTDQITDEQAEESTEEVPDFTEDLISVVEDEEEGEDDSMPELLTDDFELEPESKGTEQQEEIKEEAEIDIRGRDEDATEDIDLADLDVDFAEEVATVEKTEGEEVTEAKTDIAEEDEKVDEESTGAGRILVIDDSIVIRKMVEIALEDENYNIDTAVSGKDGLALLDEKNPDLIILDLMLPDINGIDLLKTIKASKGVPVIMLSGKDSPQMVEKARAEGADAFLPKPFKDDELVEKIKELLS